MIITLDHNGARHRLQVSRRYQVKSWLRAFATIKKRVDDGLAEPVAVLRILSRDRELTRIFRRMIKQAWRDSYSLFFVGDSTLSYRSRGEDEEEWIGEMPIEYVVGKAVVHYHELNDDETREDDDEPLFEGYSYLS